MWPRVGGRSRKGGVESVVGQSARETAREMRLQVNNLQQDEEWLGWRLSENQSTKKMGKNG